VIGFKFLPKNYEDVYDLSQRKGVQNADSWKSLDNSHGCDASYRGGQSP
jgi:hypothetical protein